MIKQVLLAGGMLIAAPAVAQTAGDAAQTAPGRVPMAATPPAADMAAAPETQGDVAQPTPAAPMTAQAAPAAPATATAQAAPAPDAAAQPTNAPTQVAAIVDREFGAYDKDGNGRLSQAEFGAWMVALKTASDPATRADSPETRKWVGAAFAQADTSKSGALTKEQLVSFLSQGQS